jgi:DNA-binding ferritin-like protein
MNKFKQIMNKKNKISYRNKTRRNKRIITPQIQNFEQEIVLKFIYLLNTVKIYHWKTRSHATHKATDELYTSLNEHIDKFIEVLLGKFGNRVDLTRIHSIPFRDFDSFELFKNEIYDFKVYLVDLNSNMNIQNMTNSDLYNIRDEILGDLNQFLYLLTFQ